jgi:hypothetical protein
VSLLFSRRKIAWGTADTLCFSNRQRVGWEDLLKAGPWDVPGAERMIADDRRLLRHDDSYIVLRQFMPVKNMICSITKRIFTTGVEREVIRQQSSLLLQESNLWHVHVHLRSQQA